MPIGSVLDEQSEEFRLLYFQLVAFYDFFKEKDGSKVRSSSWKSFGYSFSNFFDSKDSSDSMTHEGRKKTSVMQEELKGFFASTNAICFDIVLRRDLAIFLTFGWVRLLLLEEIGRTSGHIVFLRLVRWRLESG